MPPASMARLIQSQPRPPSMPKIGLAVRFLHRLAHRQAGAQRVQRRGRRHGVPGAVQRAGCPRRSCTATSRKPRSTVCRPADIGRQPARQLRRKGNEQHRVADHRRIERIGAETAVQMLCEQDRERGAADDQPPRRERRQAQRDQHGSDEALPSVRNLRSGWPRRSQRSGFRSQRRRNAQRDLHQQSRAEEERHARRMRWHQRIDHEPHDALTLFGRDDVRGGCSRRRSWFRTCGPSAAGAFLRAARAARCSSRAGAASRAS